MGKQWSCLPIFYSISFLCLILFSLRKSYNLSSGSVSCLSYLLFIGMKNVLELHISKQPTSVLNFILNYMNTQFLSALCFSDFMIENCTKKMLNWFVFMSLCVTLGCRFHWLWLGYLKWLMSHNTATMLWRHNKTALVSTNKPKNNDFWALVNSKINTHEY